MEIIDWTKPPAPKYVREPVPIFKTSLEEERYWQEQYRRWIEGYAGLTGPHYFYIQEIHLKDIYGDTIRPIWRDVDDFIFRHIDECRASGESLLIYKRREVGATSIFTGCLPLYFTRINPGATINLTSKDLSGIQKMFKDKLQFAYTKINPKIINPEPIRINDSKQLVYLRLGVKKRIDENTVEDRETEINLQETSEKPDSPTGFSGSRAIYTYVDEAPLHKRIHALLKSIDATQRKSFSKIGFLAMAGTVEDKLTPDELAAFYQLIQDADALKIRPVLVPAWMGMEETSVNGWSNEKAAVEMIMKERKRLERASDPSFLKAYKKNYPLHEDDIFDNSQMGMFEDDVNDILSNTLRNLELGKCPEAPYKIIPSNTGGYDAVPDPKREKGKGGFWIIEQPQPGLIYYQSIDGVASSKRDGEEEGSWVASTIWKGFDPKGNSYEPVCHYFERPYRIEDSYRNLTVQFRFYNKYDGMKSINYESNAATGDHFGTYLEKEGLYKKYAGKRKDLSGKGWVDTKKRGQPVNDHTRDWQIKQANIFLRKYGMNFRSPLMIRNLMLPSTTNADLRDDFFIFLTAIPNFDQPIVKKEDKRFRSVFKLVQTPQGVVHQHIRVPINPDPTNDADKMKIDFQHQMMIKYGMNWFGIMSAEEKRRYTDLATMIAEQAKMQ